MAKYYRNKENVIFDTIVTLLVLLVLAICLIPFIYILSASFSGSKALINGEVFLWPKDFNFNAYIKIFQYPNFLRAYGNTIFYTVCGTGIAMVMTCLMAYPLAHTRLKGHTFFMKLVIITTQVMWLIYDIYYRNYVATTFDVMTMISNLIGFFMVRKSK